MDSAHISILLYKSSGVPQDSNLGNRGPRQHGKITTMHLWISITIWIFT